MPDPILYVAAAVLLAAAFAAEGAGHKVASPLLAALSAVVFCQTLIGA
jgi:hypothetical protein